MKRIAAGQLSSVEFLHSCINLGRTGRHDAQLCKARAPPKAPPSRPSDIKVEVRDGGPVVTDQSDGGVSDSSFRFSAGDTLERWQAVDARRTGRWVDGGQRFHCSRGKGTGVHAGFCSGEGSGKHWQARPRQASGDSGASAGASGSGHRAHGWWWRPMTIFRTSRWSARRTRMSGPTDFQIDQVWMQQHRFNAKQVDAKAQPYDMWSFQGSSYDWGKDDVQKLTRTSSQPNVMGEAVKGGYGGGIPVVAFWTASVGEAIGHVETLPWTLSMPVKVEADGRVTAEHHDSCQCGAEAGRELFLAAEFCRGVQRRFLRAAADVVERAAERRMGNSEAFERSLQRELVRVGLRVQRDAGADAGDGAEAEGTRHQVGDAG